MSCGANAVVSPRSVRGEPWIGHAVVVGPMPVPLRWPTFETIVAIYEAFQEALEMRRTAYKEHRLSEE
jgi:hypothetical protein